MGNTDVKPVLFVPFGGEGGEGEEESGPAVTIGTLGQPGLLGLWASLDYWESGPAWTIGSLGQPGLLGVCDPGPGEGKGLAAAIWGTWLGPWTIGTLPMMYYVGANR